MATLELDIDEEARGAAGASADAGLGLLFWVAIGWMIFMFAVAIFADRAAAAEPDRHGHAGAARAVLARSTGSAPTVLAATSSRG